MNLDEPPLRFSTRIDEELVFELMGTRAVTVRLLLRLRDFVTGTQLVVMKGMRAMSSRCRFPLIADGFSRPHATGQRRRGGGCTPSGACVLNTSMEEHKQRARRALFPPDAAARHVLATFGVTVQLWSLEDMSSLAMFVDHEGLMWEMVFSSDGESLVSRGEKGTVCTCGNPETSPRDLGI